MNKSKCDVHCPYKGNEYVISKEFGGYNKAILFIGHRGDERVLQPALFGNEHEQAMFETDSGKALSEILNHCKLTTENIRFTNLLKCLLPQNGKVEEKAYSYCERRLKNQIVHLHPRAIVAFGEFCFRYMFPEAYHNHFLNQVGKIYVYNNQPVLIEHHLSKIYRLKKPEEAEKIRNFLVERRAI